MLNISAQTLVSFKYAMTVQQLRFNQLHIQPYEITILFKILFQKMSLFYGKKDEDNPYPNLDQPHEPKKNVDNTFKQKQPAGPRDSVMLSREKQPEKEPGWCERCCSCCSLEYYKDYFKVTNKDVIKRITCNLKFWTGGFFNPPEQEYDLYGPFWLYTTMIFIVGAVHNVLIYENHPKNFQYDFKVIGVALTVFYMMGLGLSAVIGLLFGCLGLKSKTSQIICIYGYSMATYIICVLLCSVNMTLMTWLFLLYGGGSKVAFILKNIFESMEVPASKKFMVTLIVIIEASIQFLVIKFAFIKISTAGTIGAAFSHMEAHNAIDDGYLHLRYFSTIL